MIIPNARLLNSPSCASPHPRLPFHFNLLLLFTQFSLKSPDLYFISTLSSPLSYLISVFGVPLAPPSPLENRLSYVSLVVRCYIPSQVVLLFHSTYVEANSLCHQLAAYAIN